MTFQSFTLTPPSIERRVCFKKAAGCSVGDPIKRRVFLFQRVTNKNGDLHPSLWFSFFLFYSRSFRSGNGLLLRPITITKKDPVLTVCFHQSLVVVNVFFIVCCWRIRWFRNICLFICFCCLILFMLNWYWVEFQSEKTYFIWVFESCRGLCKFISTNLSWTQ